MSGMFQTSVRKCYRDTCQDTFGNLLQSGFKFANINPDDRAGAWANKCRIRILIYLVKSCSIMFSLYICDIWGACLTIETCMVRISGFSVCSVILYPLVSVRHYDIPTQRVTAGLTHVYATSFTLHLLNVTCL